MKAFFVFSGQGAQFAGMGRDLFEGAPEARRIFEEADRILGYDLSGLCFNGPEAELTRSVHCQVAIYTFSCAALAAFRSAHGGIRPYGCAGLSLGEYGALYAGGAFDFGTGLKLLAERGRFMEEACAATDGGMAGIIGGTPELVKDVCAECGVFVANYNSPGQIVISGEKDKVAAAAELLKNRGVKRAVVLNVAGAFHSPLMASAGEKLSGVLENTELQLPEIPVYHNFSAGVASSVEELKRLLAQQVAGSVRWEECARKLASEGGAMIEFGPGTVLTGLMRRTLPEVKCCNINSLESIRGFAG